MARKSWGPIGSSRAPRGSPCSLAALLLCVCQSRRLGGQPPVARLAVAEMLPHRVTRRRRVARGDRVADRDMRALEGFEISPLALRAVRRDPGALTRADEAA